MCVVVVFCVMIIMKYEVVIGMRLRNCCYVMDGQCSGGSLFVMGFSIVMLCVVKLNVVFVVMLFMIVIIGIGMCGKNCLYVRIVMMMSVVSVSVGWCV